MKGSKCSLTLGARVRSPRCEAGLERGDETARREHLHLMRGAPLRAAWIAPLGAMNFAGYELAKNAMVGEKGAEGPARKKA